MLHRFWYVGQKAKSVTTNKIRVTNKEEISPESPSNAQTIKYRTLFLDYRSSRFRIFVYFCNQERCPLPFVPTVVFFISDETDTAVDSP